MNDTNTTINSRFFFLRTRRAPSCHHSRSPFPLNKSCLANWNCPHVNSLVRQEPRLLPGFAWQHPTTQWLPKLTYKACFGFGFSCVLFSLLRFERARLLQAPGRFHSQSPEPSAWSTTWRGGPRGALFPSRRGPVITTD